VERGLRFTQEQERAAKLIVREIFSAYKKKKRAIKMDFKKGAHEEDKKGYTSGIRA